MQLWPIQQLGRFSLLLGTSRPTPAHFRLRLMTSTGSRSNHVPSCSILDIRLPPQPPYDCHAVAICYEFLLQIHTFLIPSQFGAPHPFCCPIGFHSYQIIRACISQKLMTIFRKLHKPFGVSCADIHSHYMHLATCRFSCLQLLLRRSAPCLYR